MTERLHDLGYALTISALVLLAFQMQEWFGK